MVVDHRHPVAGFQQVGVLHLLRPVGVHHHQQGAPVGHEHGLVAVDEGFPVLRLPAQPVDQLVGGVFLQVDDDVGLYAALSGQTADAYGAAHAVQIGKAVAHDQNLGGVPDQLGQGVGHDAGFDLGALFHLGTAAAEKLKAEPVFDDRLVAAPGQGQLNAHVGKLQRLAQISGVHAQTDADGGVDAAGALHLMHVLNNFELVVLHALQIAAFEDDQVAIPVIALDDAAVFLAPLVQLVLHRVTDVVFDPVRLVLGQLVQIVDDDHRRHRSGPLVFQTDIVVIRYIHPVGYAHEGAALVVIGGADDVAVELVFSAADFQQRGELIFPLQQPFAAELRHHVGYSGVHPGACAAAHVEKHLVAPDDAGVIQPEHRDGQGEIHQGVVLGVLRVVGHGLDIGHQLLCPFTPDKLGIDQQQQNDADFHRGNNIQFEKQVHRRESHQEEHIHSHARFGQSLQIFVHRSAPPNPFPYSS